MFGSNRFNTKNDPLLEAVQNAMQDGEIRRQAVAYVNEAFGVYNRNAVVREDLAEYDAAIEEAYKCMKEGEKKDEKKEDKPKADYSKMREKMVGKGKDLETTRKIVGEGNDGNLANNYPPYDKVTRGDVIAGATGKDQMGGKKKVNEKKMWEALKGNQDKIDANKNNKIDAGDFKLLRARKKMDEEQIDEVSTEKLVRYRNKAGEGREKGSKLAYAKLTGKAKVKASMPKTSYMEETDYSAPDRAAVTRDNKPSTPAQTNAATSGPSAADKAALKNKIKTMQEAAYSAKAARAGKDIGKPGKEFKKIAKSAAARYGSEERGKKVAGAILKRIRAKHMKEAIGTSQYGTATGPSFGAIDKARNAPSRTAGVPRPTARPDQTSLNRMSASRGLADSGSKYAGGRPHSSSTFASTAPGAQAKVQSSKTERGWADPGKYENEVKAKTGSMQQIRQGKVQEPSTQLGTPKGGESSTQSFLSKQLGKTTANPQGPEASSPQTPQQRWDASRQASNQPSPGVAARTASAEVASGADKARDNSASVKKLMAMNESVQVGANRYRIV